MKKLFLILSIGGLLWSCDSTPGDDNKVVDGPNIVSIGDITDYTNHLKKFSPTTKNDFDTFLNILCNDVVITPYERRVVYINNVPVNYPGHEPDGGGFKDHSLESELLFFEDGTCWQCSHSMPVIADIHEYCLLEWTADRNTQTIKLVSPHLKEKGSKYAETELKLVAHGKHKYFGDNIYLVEGLQPCDDTRKNEGDFVQYFIDPTPVHEHRAQKIELYMPHE